MHSDWTDLLRLFAEEGVEYLVVGGHSLSAHGYTRVTDDLDLLAEPTAENSVRTFRALQRFGANMHDLKPYDFADEQTVFAIGVKPLRIDVLTGSDGVTYREAATDSVATTFGGVPCRAIGVEALIRYRRATDRLKDAADAEWLEANHPDLQRDS